MPAEPRRAEPAEKRLEGPGAEARLRRLQRRFAKAAPRRPVRPWRLAVLCALTFLAVLAGGHALMALLTAG